MAGGKETPRQKMIGMMYLVLTALLALNVSKSILDAFVSIEENMQASNMTQLYRGDEKKAELVEVSTDTSNKERANKALLLLSAIQDIDIATSQRIELIDQLKLKILTDIGEDINNSDGATSIIQKQVSGNVIEPVRMKLEFVNNKDAYDDPMRILLGNNTDIKNPSGDGIYLWNSLNNLRGELTGILAGSQVKFDSNNSAVFDKSYSFKTGNYNDYKSEKQLTELLRKDIKQSKVHPDDIDAIIEVYSILSKNERYKVNGVEDVHWLGKTFDHSPSVAAIASLTSLENDVLAARSKAISQIRSRVSGGEYSFNKVVPLAYGPVVANSGDDIELNVMMAAYDTDKQPRVTINSQEGSSINIKDGQGIIKLKAGGSTMSLSGTISVQKKSGQWKEEKWEHEVIIMKPSGSIELTNMNTLYRGFKNKVQATASGFDKTELQGTGLAKTKTSEGWEVVPQGRSNTASLKVIGINSSTGERKVLKTVTYKVRNLPKPSVYWGASDENSPVSTSNKKLFVKYPPEIPLNANFSVISWECSISGAPGPNPKGTGNDISNAIPLIRQASRGAIVSFRCLVRYPGNRTGRVNASFKL